MGPTRIFGFAPDDDELVAMTSTIKDLLDAIGSSSTKMSCRNKASCSSAASLAPDRCTVQYPKRSKH